MTCSGLVLFIKDNVPYKHRSVTARHGIVESPGGRDRVSVSRNTIGQHSVH